MTRDLRRYARNTTVQLVIGFFLILLILGLGLISIIYGKGAALVGLLCVASGAAPLLLIGLAFWIMERVVKNAREE